MGGRATIKAVVFDVGGVLERVDSPDAFTSTWKARLGMTDEEFDAAADQVDREASATLSLPLPERAYRQCWTDALGLSESQADEFMRDLWDWYCGELDHELMSFAASLRPTYATAILSNSGPGARAGRGAVWVLGGLRPHRVLARGGLGQARSRNLRVDL